METTKKDHFENIDVHAVLDNRRFLQSIKPLLSNNGKTNIKLIEDDEMIDNEIKTAKISDKILSIL